MAVLELGLRTSGVGTGAAGAEIRAGARRLRITEFGITLQAATASTFGLGRPANTPTTGTLNPWEVGDAADPIAQILSPGIILAAWGTAPTAPTKFIRRIGFPATIGSSWIWTFRNLIIAAAGSLVLWNLAANGVSDIYVSAEEL